VGGYEREAEELLRGVATSTTMRKGQRLLRLAVERGSALMVTLLPNRGAVISPQGYRGSTVRLLIGKGGGVSRADRLGRTPLICSA